MASAVLCRSCQRLLQPKYIHTQEQFLERGLLHSSVDSAEAALRISCSISTRLWALFGKSRSLSGLQYDLYIVETPTIEHDEPEYGLGVAFSFETAMRDQIELRVHPIDD